MWDFFIFWLVLHAVFALYLFIRSLIDPKFAEKLSEMNRRERERKARRRKPINPYETDMYGNPMYPKAYAETERKRRKKEFCRSC